MYDYLFYKSYTLAKRLKNWEDAPILFSTSVLGFGLIMNIATILFVVEGIVGESKLDLSPAIATINRFKYIFGALMMFIVYSYYSHNNRGEKIVSKYENKKANIKLPAILVLIVYYFGSSFIAMLSAMFRNGDGFFK